ncbi:MAG: HupE/UreJ family protein [Gemmatimonadota bacterium]|nr:HupE/UreJ family protein [Gemmatimonadota bacterium]
MSELTTFVHLGFRHITDLAALDHILFLLALAAIYRGRDWRDSLWVISAFTVGHSITLASAVTGALRLPTPLIEFLIPVTIVVTGLENIVVRRREREPLGAGYRPVFAGVFGLVHGAGFANYLQTLFAGSIAVPLLGFNIGIELGQLVVLGLAGVTLAGFDRALGLLRAPGAAPSAHRLRVLAVSVAIVVVAAEMAVTRRPW